METADAHAEAAVELTCRLVDLANEMELQVGSNPHVYPISMEERDVTLKL